MFDKNNQDSGGNRRITLLYLLQPTETYGYHIKAMVADVWCIRKTVK